MKNSRDTYNFLETDVCLTPELLQKYVCKQLKAKELHRVENHLLDCDLCAAAVEGWTAAGTDNIIAVTTNINKKIDGSQFKISFRNIVYALSAASVVFMIGLALMFQFQSHDSSLAMEESMGTQKKDVAVTETSKVEEEIEITDKTEQKRTVADEKNKSGNRKDNLLPVLLEENIEDEKEETTKMAYITPEKKEEEIADENADLFDDEISEKMENIKTEAEKPHRLELAGDKKLAVSGAASGNSKSGRRKKGKMKDSNKISEALSIDYIEETPAPTIDSVLSDTTFSIEQVILLCKQKDYNNALTKVDSLLIIEKKPEYLWHKAIILIATDKINEAKNILKDLSEKENPFRQKAKDKLTEF